MLIRLDKYLADMGVGTRSQVKELIKKGKVSVNDSICRQSDTKISTDTDRVVCNEMILEYSRYEYYMLNKPAGIISASSDKRERTVVDLIKTSKKDDLFPAGRLDKDTEGLLIITNDGELAHNILSPRKHVDKTYYVELDVNLGDEEARRVCEGVYIEKDVMSKPAKLSKISEKTLYLTIHEGRFHQVKKMFHAVGCQVTYLKRIKMGKLVLDEQLAPGEYRPLTEKEIKELQQYD